MCVLCALSFRECLLCVVCAAVDLCALFCSRARGSHWWSRCVGTVHTIIDTVQMCSTCMYAGIVTKQCAPPSLLPGCACAKPTASFGPVWGQHITGLPHQLTTLHHTGTVCTMYYVCMYECMYVTTVRPPPLSVCALRSFCRSVRCSFVHHHETTTTSTRVVFPCAGMSVHPVFSDGHSSKSLRFVVRCFSTPNLTAVGWCLVGTPPTWSASVWTSTLGAYSVTRWLAGHALRNFRNVRWRAAKP